MHPRGWIARVHGAWIAVIGVRWRARLTYPGAIADFRSIARVAICTRRATGGGCENGASIGIAGVRGARVIVRDRRGIAAAAAGARLERHHLLDPKDLAS